MRQILALLLVCLAGCGGSSNSTSVSSATNSPVAPPSLITPPAQAQTYSLGSLSAPVGANFVSATGSFASGYISHMNLSGGVCTLYTNTGITAVNGSSISFTPYAPATFSGTATNITVVTNTPPTYTWNSPAQGPCANYDDDSGYQPPHSNCTGGPCSVTSDGYPITLTDQAGLLHTLYVQGVAENINPANVLEKTSSDGVNWSNPVTVLTDSSGGCLDHFGTACNCSYFNIAAVVAPNGDLVLMAALYDLNSNTPKGMVWKVKHNGVWGILNTLPQPSPDASNYIVPYGLGFTKGSNTYLLAYTASGNSYLLISGDNGQTFGNTLLITASGYAKTPTNEGACVPFPAAGSIGCIFRDVGCATLASTNCGAPIFFYYNGSSWTATKTNIQPSAATTNFELIAPQVICPSAILGRCTLTYGERDRSSPSGGSIRAVTFNPADIVSNPTGFAIPQQLGTSTIVSCLYPSSAVTGSTVSVSWCAFLDAQQGVAKLYSMTAGYQQGATSVPAGEIVGTIH